MTLSQPTWPPLCLTTQMVRYGHPTPRICALVIQIFEFPSFIIHNLMMSTLTWCRHGTDDILHAGPQNSVFYTKLLVVINMMNHYHRWHHQCKHHRDWSPPSLQLNLTDTWTWSLEWRQDLGQGGANKKTSHWGLKTAAWANISFPFCISAEKPSSSRSCSLTSHHCIRRHRNDDESWTTTCSSPPAARSAHPLTSNHVAEVASKGQSRRPGIRRSCRHRRPLPSIETMMGWPRGSARHDGRLPLQVLGDIGVVDLVKRHHLWSHLLVQNDVIRQGHVSKWEKGDWGQLVVANWTEKSPFNHCHNLNI